nr:MAG TPA: hypothetical protein [Caudoviricetes sp.]
MNAIHGEPAVKRAPLFRIRTRARPAPYPLRTKSVPSLSIRKVYMQTLQTSPAFQVLLCCKNPDSGLHIPLISNGGGRPQA